VSLAAGSYVVHDEPMESPPSAPASGRFIAVAAGAAVLVDDGPDARVPRSPTVPA